MTDVRTDKLTSGYARTVRHGRTYGHTNERTHARMHGLTESTDTCTDGRTANGRTDRWTQTDIWTHERTNTRTDARINGVNGHMYEWSDGERTH